MGKFMYQGMEYGERYIKKHMRIHSSSFFLKEQNNGTIRNR